jgi:hypothetical protein
MFFHLVTIILINLRDNICPFEIIYINLGDNYNVFPFEIIYIKDLTNSLK